MKYLTKLFFFCFCIFSLQSGVLAQCDPLTPTFTVNLTGQPNGTWLSPVVTRKDDCCGGAGKNCVEFVLTLDSMSSGISLSIASGAAPVGALNYQVNCGVPVPIGGNICLTGTGPHRVTFCKPGNSPNTFLITSLSKPDVTVSTYVNNGCSTDINSTGYVKASMVWTSIFPGAPGAWNYYLNCTAACDTVRVNPTDTLFPPYVDYQVCGNPTGGCAIVTVCKIARVYFNPTLNVNITPNPAVMCPGDPGITLTVNTTGGSAPFNYQWSNLATTPSVTVGPGNYTVVVRDLSSCPPKAASVVVTQLPGPIVTNAGTDITTCKTVTSVQLTGSQNGGTGAIWTGGSNVFSPNSATLNAVYYPTPAEIAAGTTTLYLTNTGTGMCTTYTDTLKINYVNFQGTNTVTPVPASCYGSSSGSATISTIGATNPYTYSWNTTPIQTGNSASNIPNGSYTVDVTDGNGCVKQEIFSISQPTPVTATYVTSNVTCFLGSNGSATVTPFGGTSPYTFSWAPFGGTGATATNLTAGTYNVTVKDFKNCDTTISITINQPTVLTTAISNISHVKCFGGNDGQATVNVFGGTPPYSYSWAPFGGNAQTGIGLSAGNYIVTVLDSNSCSAIANVVINQPAAPLSATMSQTNILCYGGNNGVATAVVAGGTPGYSYSWVPSGATTNTITGIQAGAQTVTIRDTNNCWLTKTVTIIQPADLVINPTLISSTCGLANGSINSNVSGGVPPYTYLWSSGATTSNISNILAGSYSVIVADSNGCRDTASVIVANATPPLTASINSFTNVSCFAGNNGTATVTVSGGTANFNYSWAPIGGNGQIGLNLISGNYVVTVIDVNGCTDTSTVTITQPTSPLALTLSQTNVSCNGGNNGQAVATPSGGTPGYTYLWSNSATGSTATNLSANTYTLVVTDVKGCTKNGSVTITQPSLLTATLTKINVSCFGGNNGQATVIPVGGTAPYTYLWSNGGTGATITSVVAGTYSVTVTDSLGCTFVGSIPITQPTPLNFTFSQTNVSCFGGNNGIASVIVTGGTLPYNYSWNNGDNDSLNTGLIAGTYILTVTDGKGCVLTDSVVVNQPQVLALSSTVSNVLCFGGNTGFSTVHAIGGNLAYSFNWSPSGGSDSTALGLTAGTYSVVVTDTKGCKDSINITITAPTLLTASLTQTNVSCFGGNNGQFIVTPSGGKTPYSYLWSNGNTTSTANNLIAGNYSVTVTDSNGCTTINSGTITQPALLVSNINASINVSCFGGNNGSAMVTTSGGTTTYSYLWSTGSTTATISNLIAGTYTVTSTDNKGCTDFDTIVITQPNAPLTSTTTSINNPCFGNTLGSGIVVPSGGTSPFTFLWSPVPSVTDTISDLAAGIYFVTVKDTMGCIVSDSIQINEPSKIVLTGASITATCGMLNGQANANISGGTPGYTYYWQQGMVVDTSLINVGSGSYDFYVSDAAGCRDSLVVNVSSAVGPTAGVDSIIHVKCFGGNNGAITATGVGGTPPLTYEWLSTGNTNLIDSNLTAGFYVFQVTDSNGCQDFQTVEITQPTIMVAALVGTSVSCNGGADGTVQAFVNGGVAPYSFVWSGNSDTASLSDTLIAGNYSVTISDSNNCQLLKSIILSEPTPLALNLVGVNIDCFGGNNGSIQSVVSGGTLNYSYFWNPNLGSADNLTGLTAGTYHVMVQDGKSCQISDSIVLTQPLSGLTLALTQTDVSCFGGNNGEFVVIPSGGTSPFTYLWSNADADSIAQNLAAGNYSITVTDNNGCPSISSGIITQPTKLISNINTAVNVSCFGGNNGLATVTTSGGTTAYTYLWSTGDISTTTSNLIEGTYWVTTTDSKGCLDKDTIIITQPLAPLSSTTSSKDNLCFGDSEGSGYVTPAGGTSPYTYLWSPIPSVNDSIDNLTIGTYYVTVTDTLGCFTNDSISINQPTILTIVLTQTEVKCNGGSNGEAIVTPSGGTPDYTFLWSNADSDSIAGNLSANTYVIVVNDANGCQETDQVIISQPSLFSGVLSGSNVNCYGGNNGQASVAPFGGSTPYTFLWSNGDVNPAIINLIAGTYSVTVTDSLGCSFTDSIVVTQPSQLNFTITNTNVSCYGGNDGSASAIATGGSLPYTYSWNNGDIDSLNAGLVIGTYILTLTDGNGCSWVDSILITEPAMLTSTMTSTNIGCFGENTGSATVSVGGGTLNYNYTWSNGQGGVSITSLTAGTYYVNVTDAKGCVLIDSVTINQPPNGLSLSLVYSHVKCYGASNGEMAVNVTGGSMPYTYLWTNGDTDSIANNIPSGNYSITVNDNNGCQTSDNGIISQPAQLTTNIVNIVNTFCELSNGGALSTATGGTLPYSFLWSNGASTAAVNNIMAGSYFVTVTDSNGCSKTDSVNIANVPKPIVDVSSYTNVKCFGGNSGSAVATPSFGLPPYNYMWAPSGATGFNPTTLMQGTHYVTLTDGNGCTASDSVIISEPSVLSVNIDTIRPISCFGGSNGGIVVSGFGGSPSYSYNWSNGGTTANISNLLSGVYTVSVQDSNNCNANRVVVVTQPSQLISSITAFTNESCIASNNGTATVSHTGGIPPFTYSWNTTPIQNTATAVNLIPGTYTVNVLDSNGCTSSITQSIGSPSPVITNSLPDYTICLGSSLNLLSSASGGSGGYIYFWNNGIGVANPAIVSPTNTTNYFVNAIDQNGCIGSTDTIRINVQSLLQNNLGVIANSPICPGTNTLVYATVNNPNTGLLTYTWNNGLPNNPGSFQLTPGQPTTYILTVSNECGVSVTDSASVLFKPLPTVLFNGNGIGCAPLSVSFTDLSTTPIDIITSWLWDFGDGGTSTLQNPSYIFNNSGNFNVNLTVTTDRGCMNDTSLNNQVIIHPNPIALFTANPLVTVYEAPNITFINQSIGGINYLWDFDDNYSSIEFNPSHIYQDTGVYMVSLLVTNQFGCEDETKIPITVKPSFSLQMPNAFSPNPNGGNGGQYDITSLSNDIFYPFVKFVREFHMSIFNRWGELIFESYDVNIGWDGYYKGSICQQDVYVWKIDLKFTDGSKFAKVGDVTLIR